MNLRRIKISRPGFFILGNPNSLSPKKKREHNNAWRQRQHDTKNDRLNCSHRSPRPFDSANLLLARSACIVGFLHVNRNARPPGLVRVPEQRRPCLERGVVFLISLTDRHRDLARIRSRPGLSIGARYFGRHTGQDFRLADLTPRAPRPGACLNTGARAQPGTLDRRLVWRRASGGR